MIRDTPSRSIVAASLLATAFSIVAPAQVEKLRVDVEVATVEVSVVDRQGKPVHDLKRENFRLLEEGKERPILSIDEVRPGDQNLSPPAAGQESARPGKIVLLLFDDGTLTPAHLPMTRDLAADFVRRSMHPGDLFGVASHALSLRLLQAFTRQQQDVLRAVQQPAVSYSRNLGAAPTTRDLQRDSITGPRFRSPRMVDPSEQEMQESRVRGLSLLQSLSSLCSSLAKIKGRKTLLVFTEDLNVPTDLQGQRQETTTAAQAANVVIHSIDVRASSAAPSLNRSHLNRARPVMGMMAFQGENRNLGSASSEIGADAPFDERDPLRQGKGRRPSLENILRTVALSTGGEAIFNTSDLASPLVRLDRELSNYYVLGFSPAPVNSGPKLRHLEVQTTLKNVQVKYRKSYAASRSQERLANSPAEGALREALEGAAPLKHVPVRFEAAFFHDAGPGGLTNTFLSIKIGHEALELQKQASRRIGSADVSGVAHSLDGSVAGRFTERIEVDLAASEEEAFRSRDLLYRTSLELRPGTYRLKIAVVGKSGKAGTSERVFAVPPLPAAGLAMSSVVVTQQMLEMPGLIRDLQDRLLEESHPLRYFGAEVALPVDLEVDRQSPVVVFFKLYNLRNNQQTRELKASVQLMDDYDQGGAFPPVSLEDVAYPSGDSSASIGLSLPLKEVSPGRYRLRVATTDLAGKIAAVGETRLRVK